jgi:hypothetical protein
MHEIAKPSSRTRDWLPLLAAAVVQQAIADAHDPTLSPAVRREARRFLAGSPEYRLWERVAERHLLPH